MSQGSDAAAAGCVPLAARAPLTSAIAAPASSNALLACRSRDRTVICGPAFLAGGEVLVGAGGVLAWPLVQLLAQVGAGAVDVQAQAAAGVLELPGAVGLLHRLPQAAGRATGGLLDDVRGALRRGVPGHGHVVAGVLRLQLAVAAGDRQELELLVGLAVAGPLVDRRAGRGGVPEHVRAQGIAGHG